MDAIKMQCTQCGWGWTGHRHDVHQMITELYGHQEDAGHRITITFPAVSES